MSEKVAFILPGYSFKAEREPYTEVGEMFQERGVEPEYVEIDWQHELSENIEQVRNLVHDKLESYEDPEIYLFGHSWGAVCAFAISPDIEPKAQVLASMSPSFEEDVELFPEYQLKISNLASAALRKLGIWDPPKENEFDKPSLEDLKGKNIRDLYFLYAEREYDGWFGIDALGFGGKITENRKEMFPEAQEIVVPGATHWMNSEEYLGEVEDVIDQTVSKVEEN